MSNKHAILFVVGDGARSALFTNASTSHIKSSLLKTLNGRPGIAHVYWGNVTITGVVLKGYCHVFNAPGWKAKMSHPRLDMAIEVMDPTGLPRSIMLDEKHWQDEIARFAAAVEVGSWDYYEKVIRTTDMLNSVGMGHHSEISRVIQTICKARDINDSGGRYSRKMVTAILDKVIEKLAIINPNPETLGDL